MAAPWSVGAQVRIVGRIHGQTTNNVLHFSTNTVINDAPSEDALILALLTALLACVSEQLLPAVTSDWTLDYIEGRKLYPAAGNPLQLVPDNAVVGTASACSVSFAASLLGIRSTVGGRTGRGRLFLPPPGEGETSQSISSNTVVDQLVAFVTCLAGKFIGAGHTEDWELGVLSRKLLAHDVSNWNTSFHEAVTVIPKREQAVIGRRKLGRGV